MKKQRVRNDKQPEMGVGQPKQEVREIVSSEYARYLTNRGNLIEILSSGLIKPPRAYPKYYRDSNAGCPSVVVLSRTDPYSDPLVLSQNESPGIFPVLLDVDAEGLFASAQIVKDFVQVNTGKVGGTAMVFPGVIPASRIRAIHFRTLEELSEFQTREYANLRERNDLYRVSPQRFEGPPRDESEWEAVLGKCEEQADKAILERLKEGEAWGGALLLWAFLGERHTLPSRTDAEEKPAMESRWGERVFDLCFEVAAAHTPESFYNADMLEEVRSRLRAEMMSSGRQEESEQEYLKWMETIAGILDNSVDIDAFPPDAPEPLNALLYFLLHSDPESVMNGWKRAVETVPARLEAAVAWSGALYKHSRIPVSLRPNGQTEVAIAEWEATYTNTALTGPNRSKTGLEIALREIISNIRQRLEEEQSQSRIPAVTASTTKRPSMRTKQNKLPRRANAAKIPDVIPATAFAGMVHGNLKGVPIKADTTRFGGPGLDTDAANENLAKVAIPFNCAFRNLYVRTGSSQPISGALTLTIRKNGSNTPLVLKITPGANAGLYSETKKKTRFNAGDEFSIRLENDAKSPSAGICGWSIEYEVE